MEGRGDGMIQFTSVITIPVEPASVSLHAYTDNSCYHHTRYTHIFVISIPLLVPSYRMAQKGPSIEAEICYEHSLPSPKGMLMTGIDCTREEFCCFRLYSFIRVVGLELYVDDSGLLVPVGT